MDNKTLSRHGWLSIGSRLSFAWERLPRAADARRGKTTKVARPPATPLAGPALWAANAAFNRTLLQRHLALAAAARASLEM